MAIGKKFLFSFGPDATMQALDTLTDEQLDTIYN